ncbi:MAG: zf-HC2 domain-containing protein [Acidobacteria bacterium]|nr:zf-HC2 domain-containing protein [Acidobacteriota bacterium]
MTATGHITAARLSAFRDGELSISEHLDVTQHLRACRACREAFEELQDLGGLLRHRASVMSAAMGDEPARRNVASAVVSRVLAEQEQSWPVRVRAAFDDMHLVWAGLCATAAMVVCAGLAASLVLFAPAAERADSLRAMVTMMALSGTDLEPLPLAPGMQAPRASAEAVTPLMLVNDLSLDTDQDVELALSAVVTRDGRVEQTQQLDGAPNLTLVQSLEDSARFQPASRAGRPVAVSLVWLVSHTTVRPPMVKPQSSRRGADDIAT